MKNLKYALFLWAFIVSACSQIEDALEEQPQKEEFASSVFEGVERNFSVSFSMDTITSRTGFVYNGNDYKGEWFTWEVGDKMSVGFGENTSILTAQTLKDRLVATFGGKVPVDAVSYTYAFSPAKIISDWSNIPVSVPTSFTQNGKSTAHLSDYMNICARDFTTRNWSSEEVNNVLKFNHLMSFVRCSFINKTSKNITVTSVALKDRDDKNVFYTSATLDLTNAKKTPQLVCKTPSTTTLQLRMNDLVAEPDSMVSGYMVCMPTTLNDSLTFTVTAIVDGRSTEESFTGTFSVEKQWGEKGMKVGNIYYLKISLSDERMRLISPKWRNGVTQAQKTVIQKMIDNMVWIDRGTFNMGAAPNDSLKLIPFKISADEYPQHSVTLTENFYMNKYLLTQKEWNTLMGSNIEVWTEKRGLGDNYPAYGVDYYNALNLIFKINFYSTLTFKLPTEAQWEFAARGGNLSQGYIYAGGNNVNDVAWHIQNSDSQVHEVGGKTPNELGLYDMSGNLQEWCLDYYDAEYYSKSPLKDPLNRNPNTTDKTQITMVVRNCNWGWGWPLCRVTRRDKFVPSSMNEAIGARLVYMY